MSRCKNRRRQRSVLREREDRPPALIPQGEGNQVLAILDEIMDSEQAECLAIVRRLQGDTAAFLETPQPAFGDLTGRELLKEQPAELLERLRMLERGEE